MSIKKRLILSNLGMIVIPLGSFLLVEIILGYLMFDMFNGELKGEQLKFFVSFRIIAMVIILIVTNGLMTYYVSKSILKPIKKLSLAAKEISQGNLEFNITSDSMDEIGQLSNIFEEMRRKLKEADMIQSQFQLNRQELIASISHDLKTPLTSIKGYVQGIQDGVANTPEKLNRYMEIIYRNTTDMDSLIDELFLYSKLDLHQIPFHFEEVDLKLLFSDFIDELSFMLEKEHGRAILSYDCGEIYLVEADRDKLYRVVTNIVQNSLKYMDKEQKEITINLTSFTDEVIVEIKDNGSGISNEDLPYIFESFYRADMSRNSSKGGSGLGLSIAKKIIEGHEGKIWCKSTSGIGTSIYFKLKKVK
ncbi:MULTISPECIES: HAMP domain-containing sensor histidine kinase [Bacillaceae]|uniref:sensor histidine kinase n=1 Tax=Bacillaceae TaxID=186817 RepID=UPI001042A3C9|nr:HAMP domain-containing sensor histidine kinase [Bacillus sp. CBEL-1]TDB51060.1 HAMP domain-containing histidine kinase [Bacillus sp. CBEL-1]